MAKKNMDKWFEYTRTNYILVFQSCKENCGTRTGQETLIDSFKRPKAAKTKMTTIINKPKNSPRWLTEVSNKVSQVEVPGIEPGASCMLSTRSTTELHPPLLMLCPKRNKQVGGGGPRVAEITALTPSTRLLRYHYRRHCPNFSLRD